MKFMWITSIWQKRADRMLYCCNLQPGMLQIKCYVCFAHSLIRPCPKSEQVASLLVRKSLIIGGTIQPTWWDVVSFVCLFACLFFGRGGANCISLRMKVQSFICHKVPEFFVMKLHPGIVSTVSKVKHACRDADYVYHLHQVMWVYE